MTANICIHNIELYININIQPNNIERVYAQSVLCCCPPTVGVTIESVYVRAVLYCCPPTVGVTPTPMVDCSTDSNHIYTY